MEVVDQDQTSLSSIKQEREILEDHPPDFTVNASSILEPIVEIKTEPDPEPEFVDPDKIDVKYPSISSVKVEEDQGDPLSCDKDYSEESIGEEYGELNTAVKKTPEIQFVSCGELIDEKQGSENKKEMDSLPEDIIPASGNGGRGSQLGEPTTTGKKTFTCSVCKRCFSRHHNLMVHSRRHTGEKLFACAQCERTFTTLSQLRRHIRSHSGEKPFKCVECNISFSESGNLKKHLTRHSGEKPFACMECPKTFFRQHDLKNHSRTHTGEKPYSCSICHNAFSHLTHLKDHMRTHTGERPYSCNACPNAYARSSDLKVHMRTHSGERPYSCTECSSTFTRSCYLLRHKKTHSI